MLPIYLFVYHTKYLKKLHLCSLLLYALLGISLNVNLETVKHLEE